MKAYAFWSLNALQSAGFVPPNLRRRILRWMGLQVADTALVREGCFFGSPRITLAEKVFVSVGCFLDGSEEIRIGRAVHLAPKVQVLTSTHEVGGPEQRAGAIVRKPVEIGDGCWIGAGATIMPGIALARGCVVAARAVVTRDTDTDGLYLGLPAARVKDL